MMTPFPVFIIGVARAGTTLAARVASSSSKAAAAFIDSQESMLKAVRTEIANRLGFEITYDAPWVDGYYNLERRNFIDAIQASDLKKIDISRHREKFSREVAESSRQFSPLVVDEQFYSGVHTAWDGINKIIESVVVKDRNMVIFKDNYVIDFALPLKKAFPTAKFIFPYRDPRAVIASRIAGGKKFNAGEQVHLLSRLRAWRSHLAWAHSFVQAFPDDAMLLPYENMATDPTTWTQQLCDFLSVPFEEAMLGECGFKTKNTPQKWGNNSSFNVCHTGIFKDSVAKWRHFLSDELILGTEYLCFHEMSALGYVTEKVKQLPVEQDIAELFLANDRKVNASQLWRCDTMDFCEEVACEQARHACILKGQATQEEARLLLLSSALADFIGVKVV